MRDVVEIGIGREARRTYTFDDIALVPARRTRSSKEIDTGWQLDAYEFDIPVMAHPTDATMSPETCIALGQAGGLGVFNAEGIFARHADADSQLAQLAELAVEDIATGKATALLQELHAAPIDEELLISHIQTIRASGVTTAARVSPQHARDLTPVLIKAGIDLLVIQGTLISAEHVTGSGEPLNLKEFIGSLDVPVIAGGVVDYATALHLMRTGAAGVIVGPGTTTTPEVLGIEVPMATAVADAAAARRDYLDETGGRYVHVIADGDLLTSGDVAKAIACGADAVSLGEMLAVAAEAPGKGMYWQATAAHPSLPRGYVDPVREDLMGPDHQDVPLAEVLGGPARSALGQTNIVGALRRSMAKCGYTDLKSFQKVGLTIR